MSIKIKHQVEMRTGESQEMCTGNWELIDKFLPLAVEQYSEWYILLQLLEQMTTISALPQTCVIRYLENWPRLEKRWLFKLSDFWNS